MMTVTARNGYPSFGTALQRRSTQRPGGVGDTRMYRIERGDVIQDQQDSPSYKAGADSLRLLSVDGDILIQTASEAWL